MSVSIIKHIHAVVSSITASPYNKFDLTVILVSYKSDGSDLTEEYKSFILPDNSSDLQTFSDNIYGPVDRPSNISKGDFDNLIIQYLISQPRLPDSAASNQVSSINSYLDSLTNTEQSKQQVEDLFSKKAFSALKEKNAADFQKQKDNLTVFESSSGGESAPYDSRSSNRDRLENIVEQTPEDQLDQKQKELFGDKPAEGGKRPVQDMSGLTEADTKVFSNLPQESLIKFKGVGGARLIEPVPGIITYPGDVFLKSQNNSGIICGRDEIYRLRGHTKSGAVYIYAGRQGSVKGKDSSNDNFSNPDAKVSDQPNNLITDSSYIYISQKADVDSLYKYKVAAGNYSKVIKPLLPKGERETRQGISLAAIKADDVLIMSRTSGIRLVTGTDKKNSKGADQNSKFGIDLIAGNDDSDLQPLVKGDNLVKYLTRLSKTVDELRSILYDFMNSQSKFNTKVSAHTHYDPFTLFLGQLGQNNPFGIDIATMFGALDGGGKCPPSLDLITASTVNLLENIRQQANTVNLIMNQVGNETNAFNAIGAYNILSDRNRTN